MRKPKVGDRVVNLGVDRIGLSGFQPPLLGRIVLHNVRDAPYGISLPWAIVWDNWHAGHNEQIPTTVNSGWWCNEGWFRVVTDEEAAFILLGGGP